jgi:sugar O-acyltransferase (sialic acid O-acetyltransferase NeuD family)
MTTSVGIYGLGGFGREVLPLVQNQSQAAVDIYFVESQPSRSHYCGIPVMNESHFLDLPGEKYFTVAIANSRAREDISHRMIEANCQPLNVIDRTSQIYGTASIGHGAIVCANTMITDSATVGGGFHLNIYSYVAHDCRIGDWVTFAPGVRCNGNVTIGDHAYIGSGAMIRQGTHIGAGAVVGMGAVVVKDVDAGVTVIGNPARPMIKS